MDNDRERQRRDLQRATALLETMSREEIVEMLHDILFNDRSDDTSKLSDWMAFQIIIQDETRDARKLLSQLGKDGRNRRRLEVSKMANDTCHRPPISSKAKQGHNDELEDDSSSTASFVTCPEADSVHCTPVHGVTKICAPEPTHGVLDEAILAEAHELSAEFAKTERRQAGKKKELGDDRSPLYTSQVKKMDPSRFKAAPNFPLHPLVLAQTRSMSRIASSPMARTPKIGKIRRAAFKVKTSRTTYEVGQANLAELYARFNDVRMEGWRADLLEIDAREGLTHAQRFPESYLAFELEDPGKRQCHFCKLYYSAEQNLRELDNGSAPCSHHPGALDWDDRVFFPRWYSWTCCRRGMFGHEFGSGPLKIPGCATGYHSEMRTIQCALCKPSTKEGKILQPGGISSCINHEGLTRTDGNLPQFWLKF